MTVIPNDIKQQLVSTAEQIAAKAYAPYSHFHVGAAILAENDQIYTGVNVENQSYGLTICAERSAVVKMVTDGVQGIKAIAVSTTVGYVKQTLHTTKCINSFSPTPQCFSMWCMQTSFARVH